MSKMAIKIALVLGLVGTSLVGTSASAEAALLLRLTSGMASVTISDGGPGDVSGAGDGAVAFFGSIGGFGFNLVGGVSDPSLGPAELDLASLNIFTESGWGTLIIELTDTDYTAGIGTAGALQWAWGGTVSGGGSITGQAWKDPSNAEFGEGSITSGLLGPFAPPGFFTSGSTGHGILTDDYSMTIRLIYSATGQGQSYSGDFILQNVPEPAELVLFGLGLTAVGLAARRRRRIH